MRVDILPTLDGFEPGLRWIPDLRLAGVRILNPPAALLGAHDKLETALRLRRAAIAHPPTQHVTNISESLTVEPPLVVKPRFGSWGRDIFRCETRNDARRCLAAVSGRSWFQRQGALVQQLVPIVGTRDLRVIVAGGRVVGAATREPRPGEWRSNVSLGGSLFSCEPDRRACELALAAVRAVGGDLVGVDLLPSEDGWVVLELNGAVDFDDRYSLPGRTIYGDVAVALDFLPLPEAVAV